MDYALILSSCGYLVRSPKNFAMPWLGTLRGSSGKWYATSCIYDVPKQLSAVFATTKDAVNELLRLAKEEKHKWLVEEEHNIHIESV